MNKLFKELINEEESDFVYMLEEKAIDYMKENKLFKKPFKSLISLDLNSRTVIEKIKSNDVKKVLIPNKEIYIKKINATVSKFKLETYLIEEKKSLLLEKEDFKSIIDDMSLILGEDELNSFGSDYYIKSQIKELDELIANPVVQEEKISKIMFNDEIVDVEVFCEKMKEINQYEMITSRIYLIKENESTFTELYILKFLKIMLDKEVFTKSEFDIIAQKYIKIEEGLGKYSFRSLYY